MPLTSWVLGTTPTMRYPQPRLARGPSCLLLSGPFLSLGDPTGQITPVGPGTHTHLGLGPLLFAPPPGGGALSPSTPVPHLHSVQAPGWSVAPLGVLAQPMHSGLRLLSCFAAPTWFQPQGTGPSSSPGPESEGSPTPVLQSPPGLPSLASWSCPHQSFLYSWSGKGPEPRRSPWTLLLASASAWGCRGLW